MSFEPGAYGPETAALLGDGMRLTDLGPGNPNHAIEPLLRALRTQTQLSRACQSALWLYHDFLDESHTISQDIETCDGSFWHAIMHRREPDPSNSKYWWRKVGAHPVLDRLREQCPSIGYRFTTPQEFVDFCERVRGSNTADEELAKRVQLLEWQLLFDHCYRKHPVNER